MCGIAGVCAPKINSGHLSSIGGKMLSQLLHRGPDQEGMWESKKNSLFLGHRRLAIHDLTDLGKQPMKSSSGRYIIVFNGEIYNFKELSIELKRMGFHFKGRSDTEVLLASIEKQGLEKTLRQVVGMFAFALWDIKDERLYLCRDRMGEKPLYYGWVDNKFLFGSELKAIKAGAQKSLDMEIEALEHYFRYGYISDPKSIYRGIYKLQPGTFICLPEDVLKNKKGFSYNIGGDKYSPKEYWSISKCIQDGISEPFSSISEAIDELDDELEMSIAQQLQADVSVGTFLSGGIDSTLVSAIAQKISSNSVKTYTIGFPNSEYDESGYAEAIASHIGTEHLTLGVSYREALEVIPKLQNIYCEPFADSSQIPTYLISQKAKEYVTVCLSGDGGDELFGGYNRYIFSDRLWKKYGDWPLFIRDLISKILSVPPYHFWDSTYKLYTILVRQNTETGRLVGLKVQKLARIINKQDIYEAYDFLLSCWDMPETLLGSTVGVSKLNNNANSSGLNTFLDQVMYHDQLTYLPGDNLTKVDRASMAVSLETRLPLLNHKVVELSWRFQSSQKVLNGQSKWPLRQLLKKYVPDELIERPKMGFSVPISKWLREELRPWAEDLMLFLESNSEHCLNRLTVNKVWSDHINCRRDNSYQLWAVFMYLSWFQGQKN